MNKMTLLFFPLILASIACMETTSTINLQPAPTAIPTKTQAEPASGAVYEIPTWTESATPTVCAEVTAAQALHLRAQPNEHAPVIEYLRAGERVTLDEHSGAWWEITTRQGKSGYSKADYLQIVTCP